jgi:hypothetical protein
MTTAMIQPLRSGEAVFELNGVTHLFPNWREAAREAEARRIRWVLDRFPPPAVGS